MPYDLPESTKVRGTYRTTRLLEKVCDMLYDGQYNQIAFVVHHRDFIRYAIMLVQDHCQPRALFIVSQNRLVFRNRDGNNVSIQFIPMDREYEMTRGYMMPVARDHEVIRRRVGYVKPLERRVIDELMAAQRQPFSELYIPKQY